MWVRLPLWWLLNGSCSNGRRTCPKSYLKGQKRTGAPERRRSTRWISSAAERRTCNAQVEISKFSSSSRRRPCRAARRVFESRVRFRYRRVRLHLVLGQQNTPPFCYQNCFHSKFIWPAVLPVSSFRKAFFRKENLYVSICKFLSAPR